MPKPKTSRKALFRAALALEGLSQASWARREKITPQWLSLVLNGKEDSITLTEKIDAFVRDHLLTRARSQASRVASRVA